MDPPGLFGNSLGGTRVSSLRERGGTPDLGGSLPRVRVHDQPPYAHRPQSIDATGYSHDTSLRSRLRLVARRLPVRGHNRRPEVSAGYEPQDRPSVGEEGEVLGYRRAL
jgi:hypothetical protein